MPHSQRTSDGDEAKRKQSEEDREGKQIMKNQDQDQELNGRHFRWNPVSCCRLHKNNENAANWVSRVEIKKPRESKKTTLSMACYHLQLNASTLGRQKLCEPQKKKKKQRND